MAYEHHIWGEPAEKGYPLMSFTRRCHYASRLVHVLRRVRRPQHPPPLPGGLGPGEGVGAAGGTGGDRDGPPHGSGPFLSLSEKASETRTPLVGPVADGAWTSDLVRTAAEMTEAAGQASLETPGL